MSIVDNVIKVTSYDMTGPIWLTNLVDKVVDNVMVANYDVTGLIIHECIWGTCRYNQDV